MKKVKARVFKIIQAADEGDLWSRIFDISIIALILINVIIVIMDTFTLPPSVKYVSRIIETISVIVFTIEYLLRMWTSDLLFPELTRVKALFRYLFSFMAIIDLLSILPFYLPAIFPFDLKVLRTLRMIRLFRIFKINRYTNALHIVAEVFRRKASQLLSTMFVVFILIIITSVLMYNIENEAQPDTFQNIFQGMWWSIATFTTVGYGDIYPITVAGKILSAVLAFLGIGLVAVPTGIISSGFTEVMEEQKNRDDAKHYCPYCGGKLN